MDTFDLVVDIKIIERRLTLYEEKYGVLSKDFYDTLMSGKFSKFDEYDETRADFSRWKGIYETWLRRKQEYDRELENQNVEDLMRLQPTY